MKDLSAIIRVWGGVGNQLFIYAFARFLNLKYHISVFLETRTGFTHDGYNRVYRLPKFNVTLPEAKFFYTLYPFVNRKSHFIKNILFSKIFLFEEDINYPLKEISEDILPSQEKPIIYFQGYWQSFRWEAISKQLRDEFAFVIPIGKEFSYYKERIDEANKQSVAVHFRRTQYDNSLLSLNYYRHAIMYMSDVLRNPYFFVFSDDLDWCKNTMIFEDKDHFFVKNFENELFELKLMSYCSNFIIANSTYSWWGAWMSQNEDKTVIMPSGYIDHCMNGNVVFI